MAWRAESRHAGAGSHGLAAREAPIPADVPERTPLGVDAERGLALIDGALGVGASYGELGQIVGDGNAGGLPIHRDRAAARIAETCSPARDVGAFGVRGTGSAGSGLREARLPLLARAVAAAAIVGVAGLVGAIWDATPSGQARAAAEAWRAVR